MRNFLSVFKKVLRKFFYQAGKKCQLMDLSRVWVGRISKTRDILKTSECPKSIKSFRFPKFITGFVTIFDQSSVVKFLYLVKKINKLSFLSYFISTCIFPSYHDDIHWKCKTWWDFVKKLFRDFQHERFNYC